MRVSPRELLADRGRALLFSVISEVSQSLSIIHGFATAYHAQTNDLTERLNRTLTTATGMQPYLSLHLLTTRSERTRLNIPLLHRYGRESALLINSFLPLLLDSTLATFNYEAFVPAEEARLLSCLHTLYSQDRQ